MFDSVFSLRHSFACKVLKGDSFKSQSDNKERKKERKNASYAIHYKWHRNCKPGNILPSKTKTAAYTKYFKLCWQKQRILCKVFILWDKVKMNFKPILSRVSCCMLGPFTPIVFFKCVSEKKMTLLVRFCESVIYYIKCHSNWKLCLLEN